MRVKKDKKKVEIASSGKKNENNRAKSGGGKANSVAASASSLTKASVNKKRPPSAKNPSIQKKGSQDEKMNRSIDKTPRTPDEQQHHQQSHQKDKENDGSAKTTTNEEVSEDDKSTKEIITQAEIHATETIQMTDVDEGVLTDATYTIDKREVSEVPTIKEEVVMTTTTNVSEGNKKVSFKGDDEVETVQQQKEEEKQPPVELPVCDEKMRAASPLPPLPELPFDELPENIPRPKSQTPESVGSFTILEDGDDAEQKLKEFDEMTQDDYRQQQLTTTTGDEDESEEQQYFDDSSSMEKLPRRTKLRDGDGFAIIDDAKDQDSGIEPSPRAQPRTSKIPAPRFSNSSAIPTTRRSFIVSEDRPRSTRIEGRKPGDKNSCNMTTVTQSIQKNMRR